MPTHQALIRDLVANTVVDQVDQGTLNVSGRVWIFTANHIVKLAVIVLPDPAFSASVSGVATGLGMPLSDALADADGTAAEFDVVNRDENVIFSGTIALAGGDMTVPDTEIALDDIIKIISLNYTAPP